MDADSKRLRMKNFSELEKQKLVDLIKKFPIILSKEKTSSVLNSKIKAWESLQEEYNADQNVTHRELDQLKACISNLTCKAKKEEAVRRRDFNKTGGGPSNQVVSPETEIITSLIPSVFKPLDVPDSDDPVISKLF